MNVLYPRNWIQNINKLKINIYFVQKKNICGNIIPCFLFPIHIYSHIKNPPVVSHPYYKEIKRHIRRWKSLSKRKMFPGVATRENIHTHIYTYYNITEPVSSGVNKNTIIMIRRPPIRRTFFHTDALIPKGARGYTLAVSSAFI